MVSVRASAWGGVYHDLQMDDLVGTAVRVTAERHRADEWAIVRAAGSIPHRLRPRLDGWALIVAARDAEAAREALDAYDRENVADAPHVIGNAGASVVLVGAVSHQLGPGVGLGYSSWPALRSEEHTSELQSHVNLVCRLL